MMELVFIPRNNIKSVWPLIHGLMKQGVTASNRRMTIPSIKEMAMSGDWQMWLVWNQEVKIPKAVFFTELYEEINGLKIGTMRFFSGADRKDWVNLLSDLEEHMRNAGVQRMEIWARRGWLKELPDYKLTHVLLEKDLDDGTRQIKVAEHNDNGAVRAVAEEPRVDIRSG